MKPLAVLATGLITSVGLNAPAACAAMRCAIDQFQETRFMDRGGEWIIGATVPLDPPSRGREKLLRMAASAAAECLTAANRLDRRQIPVLLCLAEESRPGRLDGLDDSLLADVCKQLQMSLPADSAVIANGRVGGVEAVQRAGELIDAGAQACLVVGVDSFLVGATLAYYEEQHRLLTSLNSDGFIPGEAGAAVLLGLPNGQPRQTVCLGIGFGQEKATVDSEEPLRADGLSAAIKAALADANCTYKEIDFRITDANGEQYRFKEASLALTRTMRILKPEFDIWHPADCIGEIGAAIVPCVLGVAAAATTKNYALGTGVLGQFGNDAGTRAVLVIRSESKGAA